ncbi:hypothetical protein [Achromobacter xylosoxidans]|uniref:hypothetical protein n=1 Tax=Alcaligenes xylosoxydans xylosoxydans TaxID=85698 RepID=UPI0015652F11|nr:hypothetical protein [Achromobacter xylosoxidans]MCZ8388106.1 hypothetical protein [Achromobacter xylosoxidans]QKI72779.1 hypothetical protein HPS44_25640 [Achromobacter xylosoxidans]
MADTLGGVARDFPHLRDEQNFNRAGRSLPHYSDVPGICAPRALLPRCRDKPRRPPRRSALLRLHASRRPTRQEIPGSFFQRTRTCFVGSEIQFPRVLFSTRIFQPWFQSSRASVAGGISSGKQGFKTRVFQELKPAATSNLHRCSKT